MHRASATVENGMKKDRDETAPDRALLRMPRLLDPAYILLLVAVLIAAGFIFNLTKQNAWLRAEAAKNSSALLKKEAIQVGGVAPAFKTRDFDWESGRSNLQWRNEVFNLHLFAFL